ncbi:MAG: putative DNA binding domain-containing protein [Opitutales bacterium]|nr:putative DNA binding domain-containing protein [Opitutales bacterium]
MPLPINIADLLHGRPVEWERLEYKKGWNPEDILHSLCAFANDFHNLGGGYILVGVEEKEGRPVLPPKGLTPSSIDSIQKEILRLGQNAIQPAYNPLVFPHQIDSRDILVIWAPGGETRPYKARAALAKDSREWVYYIRKHSSTVRARGSDERELLSLAATVPFDDRYNQQASLPNLSRRLMGEFLSEIGSDLAREAQSLTIESLGRQMNVVGGPAEAPFPKNVGLLFFNEHPDRFFPATQIDVVWFPEGAGGDRFDEKIFKGPLSRMTREALDYIKRNYLTETVIKQRGRAEAKRIVNFPYEAIEEAIVNAVYHRSYEEREPIEVRITRDDLVVLSFPGPDRSIRMDALREGRAVSRRYRNRRIGEFLKELDLTEGRSTGIPKILRAMHDNGSPAPEFETDEDRTFFLIRLPVHPRCESRLDKTSNGDSVPERIAGTKLALSRHQVSILNKCLEPQPLTILMALADRSDRTKFRNQVLGPLLAASLIEMTIPEKPRSPLQKYRLTESGEAAVGIRKEDL